MGQAQSAPVPVVQPVPEGSAQAALAKKLFPGQQAMQGPEVHAPIPQFPTREPSEEHHLQQACPIGCVVRGSTEHFGTADTNWLLWIVILIILCIILYYAFQEKPKA